ncbi:bidirectional sugar transporter SWEET3-like isoform X2 [Actinidia eriantha]|nr:bidirectional sugar transporter SWEET3-like isoform X2 [Actinidia eriantha]
MITIPVILVSCVTAMISAFSFHDHHHRKAFVGSVGLVASISMYGSPLVVMKRVIQTKSVEFMPFDLSYFSFLASPNLVGTPLGVVQLVLYCKYRKKGIMEEPKKLDIEKNIEKTKQQLEIIVTEDTNGKI